MEEKLTTHKIEVNLEILRSTNIPKEEFFRNLQFLSELLRSNFLKIVPLNYQDTNSIKFFNELAKNLRKLKEVKGFDKFLKNFKEPGSKEHCLFVISIVASLLEKVENLELEPLLDTTPDILLDFKDKQIAIECKILRPSEEAKEAYRMHKRMLDEFFKMYLGKAMQIDVTFRSEPEEIITWVKHIYDVVSKTSSYGTTTLTDGTRILLTPKTTDLDSTINFIVEMRGFSENIDSGFIVPQTIRAQNNISVSFAGPETDEADRMIQKLNDARHQTPVEISTMLVINVDNFIGRKSNTLSDIGSRFQPKQNTRISGVLLTGIVGTRFIRNPFAKYPLPEGTEDLFKKINQ